MTAISTAKAKTIPAAVAVCAKIAPEIGAIIVSAGSAAPDASIKGGGRFPLPGLPVSVCGLGVYCYSRRQQNQSCDNRNFLHFHTPKINF
jgi:hypothetical protein